MMSVQQQPLPEGRLHAKPVKGLVLGQEIHSG